MFALFIHNTQVYSAQIKAACIAHFRKHYPHMDESAEIVKCGEGYWADRIVKLWRLNTRGQWARCPIT